MLPTQYAHWESMEVDDSSKLEPIDCTAALSDVQAIQCDKMVKLLGYVVNKTKAKVARELRKRQGKSVGMAVDVPFASIKPTLNQANSDADLGDETSMDPDWVSNAYTCMEGFMTVFLALVEVILKNLDATSSGIAASDTTMIYLSLFSGNGDLVTSHDDIFGWYYAAHGSDICDTLFVLFEREKFDIIDSLEHVDTIFTRFYTHYLLRPIAKDYQRYHGQYYTPRSVVQFMWDRCFQDVDKDALLSGPHLPRVFDPCLGIGTFFCEYLKKMTHLIQQRGDLWHNGRALQALFLQLPSSLWGVEVDPFAHRLGVLSTILHLFPLFKRCVALGASFDGVVLDKLCIFCNDSLLLELPDPQLHPWEHEQITRLRDPNLLQFDFILTNPPYQNRLTGNVVVPDIVVYDPAMFNNRKGSQAYIYFMILCLQRLKLNSGQICLITPAQWTTLRHFDNHRIWLWQEFQLLEGIMFPHKKVWPKIQTDSLIMRARRRQVGQPSPSAIFMEHRHPKATLAESLDAFRRVLRDRPVGRDPEVKFKLTPTDDVNLVCGPPYCGSFALFYPAPSATMAMEELTRGMEQLGGQRDSPLKWRSGPNPAPLYALVVRTDFARAQFGDEICKKWLRPVFYWNWKSLSKLEREINSKRGDVKDNDKDRHFWLSRDPDRMHTKEWSHAEAYVQKPPRPGFAYSIIMVEKDDIKQLDHSSPLYKYLREVKDHYFGADSSRDVAWSTYRYNATNEAYKLVHPMTVGYSPNITPRQRFFLDRDGLCLTSKCMYYTINDDVMVRRRIYKVLPGDSEADKEESAYLFFLGLLNSSIVRHFTSINCRVNVLGHMRFYPDTLGKIPYQPPTREHAAAMVLFVDVLCNLRNRLFTMLNCTPDGGPRSLLEKIRTLTWDLAQEEIWLLNKHVKIDERAPFANAIDRAVFEGDVAPAVRFKRLLVAQSLMQHAVEHVVYDMYKVPWDLRLELEAEHDLTLTSQWQSCQDLLQLKSPVQLAEAILNGTLDVESIINF
ncbi:S-adenosyl-L-methionine-dependent methyltransferase [Gongronella butleri]|nr:S-adenosyl-L-methionine-dependent methyltransferase [Gongronella butleri]